MAKKQKKRRLNRRVEPILKPGEGDKLVIDYKNYEELGRFLSDRAKVYGRKRTGLTAKQQRRLATSVKHARHLGLLPYSQAV